MDCIGEYADDNDAEPLVSQTAERLLALLSDII